MTRAATSGGCYRQLLQAGALWHGAVMKSTRMWDSPIQPNLSYVVMACLLALLNFQWLPAGYSPTCEEEEWRRWAGQKRPLLPIIGYSGMLFACLDPPCPS